MSDFSGVDRVISAKSETLWPRELGVTGFNLRSAIFYPFSRSNFLLLGNRSSKDVDPVTSCDLHNRTLGIAALSKTVTGELALTLTVHGVDLENSHLENLFNGDLDLSLVCIWCNNECVLVLI